MAGLSTDCFTVALLVLLLADASGVDDGAVTEDTGDVPALVVVVVVVAASDPADIEAESEVAVLAFVVLCTTFPLGVLLALLEDSAAAGDALLSAAWGGSAAACACACACACCCCWSCGWLGAA